MSRKDDLWAIIGAIRVKCPKCAWYQNVRTVESVKCFRCGRVYKVFPKRGRSRVWVMYSDRLDVLSELRNLKGAEDNETTPAPNG